MKSVEPASTPRSIQDVFFYEALTYTWSSSKQSIDGDSPTTMPASLTFCPIMLMLLLQVLASGPRSIKTVLCIFGGFHCPRAVCVQY